MAIGINQGKWRAGYLLLALALIWLGAWLFDINYLAIAIYLAAGWSIGAVVALRRLRSIDRTMAYHQGYNEGYRTASKQRHAEIQALRLRLSRAQAESRSKDHG